MLSYTADGRKFESHWEVLQNSDMFTMAASPGMPDCIPSIFKYFIQPADTEADCYHTILTEVGENAAWEALCQLYRYGQKTTVQQVQILLSAGQQCMCSCAVLLICDRITALAFLLFANSACLLLGHARPEFAQPLPLSLTDFG